MRGKKRSPAVIEQVERADMPEPRPRWQEIDERLQRLARGVLDSFHEFAAAAKEAYKEKIWERFGYQDPEPYFVERIGIAPRTFRRYLRVQNMVALLPPALRTGTMDKLARIGPNKAEVIAGIVER